MKKKETKNSSTDLKEMFLAMQEIQKTKGIPIDVMIESIKKSIEKACKSNYNNDDVVFAIDTEKGVFQAYIQKTVVEEVTDPDREVDEKLGRELDVRAVIGSKVRIPVNTKNLGRISVQNARSVIRQGIRDKEREITLQEFKDKENEIVTALVENIDPVTGNASIRIDKSIATLTKAEQVGLEDLKEGDSVRVYIAEVKEQEPGKKGKNKGPRAIISRTSNDFVRKLFELEVPEIFDGVVEIKSIAREAGSRTKIAVLSRNPDVDSVGACIGARGVRVAKIVEELGGEKIDIIEYKEKPEEFIAAALSPANVVKVEILDEENKSCRVTVPDSQLSLAIGNRGQNARLAARLTNWKVDIRPESGFYGEENENEGEELVENESDVSENVDSLNDAFSEDSDVLTEEPAAVNEETSDNAEQISENINENADNENSAAVNEETSDNAEQIPEDTNENADGENSADVSEEVSDNAEQISEDNNNNTGDENSPAVNEETSDGNADEDKDGTESE